MDLAGLDSKARRGGWSTHDHDTAFDLRRRVGFRLRTANIG